MIYLCFLFFLIGFTLITAGVVAIVLHAINTGSWPKLEHPKHWDTPIKKMAQRVGLGALLVLAGIMTGYAI